MIYIFIETIKREGEQEDVVHLGTFSFSKC